MNDDLQNFIAKVESDLPFRSNPPFHAGIASEPTVQVLFPDFVCAGDYVFDIGAHIGVMTQALSRIVGPFGRVLSVEANPGTVPYLTANIVKNALNNCFIINEAVWHQSGEFLNLVEGGAASAVSAGATGATLIQTTTIDDLCVRYGRSPSFLKIDIEGVEFEALQGAVKLLTKSSPPLVFEHNVGDDRALEFLRSLNYWTMCASTYEEVRTSEDLDQSCIVTNILAIPQTANALKYQGCHVELVKDVVEFSSHDGDRVFRQSASIELPAGRYIVEVGAQFRDESTVFTRISHNRRVLSELCTQADFFFKNHKHITFNADTTGTYTFEAGEYLDKTAPALAVYRAKVSRVVFVR